MSTISTTSASVTMGQNGVTSPLTITTTGRITGVGSTPAISNAYGSITNFGSITNTGANTISSTAGILQGGTTLTVVNTGLISGGRSGIYNNVSGTLAVTNGSTGSISGLVGILTSDTSQILNQGMISGSNTGVLQFGTATGTVTNTGVITGLQAVFMDGTNGTVINAGTISGVYGVGVQLNAGGAVTNAAGGRITGGGEYTAVGITGGAARLMNAGTIAGFTGVTFGNTASTLTLAAGGTITGTGGTAVRFGTGNDTMLLGAGAMALTGTVDGGTGTDSFSVGATATTLTGSNASFVNFEAGSIAANGTLALLSTVGFGAGLTLTAAGTLDVRGSVTNAGLLTVGGTGAVSVSGGTLTNAAGGTVARAIGYSAVQVQNNGTVTNLGTITSGSGAGISFSGGGTVVNGSAGAAGSAATIVSQTSAIYSSGGATAVTNFGTLQGDDGIRLNGTGTVVNGASGTTTARITGTSFGVIATGSATLTNFGTIEVDNNIAVPGSIAVVLGGVSTMTNTGVVSGGFGRGISLAAGSITNTGTVTGITGVVVTGPNATLTNAGTITGTGGTAIILSGTGDVLKLVPGQAITGTVDGRGVSTLELAAGTATLSGLNTQYVNFTALHVDAGANWTLATSTSFAGTVVNSGTLVVQAGQSLALGGALSADAGGAGRITVIGSASLNLSGAVAASETLDLSGTGGLLLLNAPMSMAGTVAGFGLGDTLDLRAVGTASGATLGANNVLTVSTGSGPISLQLDPTASYAGSFFAVAADGAGGTAVTLDTLPLLGGTAAGQAVTDKATIQPFSAVTVTDPDAGATEAVTITITAGGAASDADGLLSGTGLTKAGNGTYTLASGTPAAVQAALRALVFTPTTNQVPSGGTVTTGFTLSVSDGIATSPTVDSATTVNATSVNDPPVAGGLAASQAVADNATASPFAGFTLSDPDAGASETVTITLTAAGAASDANGTLSGTGLTKTGPGVYTVAAGSPAAVQAAVRTLVFTPTANQVAPGGTVTTGIALSVSDGTATAGANTAVVATSVNDAPTVGGTAAGQAVPDNAAAQPFSAVTITDPDVGASEAVTITVTAGGAASDADGLLSGTGLTKTGTGTYTLAAGSPVAVQAALRALVFTPTANQAAPGSTVTTGFSLSVSDGIAAPVTEAGTSVVATSVNDAPTLGGTVAAQVVTDKATLQPFATAMVADPDPGASEAVQITVTAGGAASDADGLLSGTGLSKTGTGTYTLAAGTPAAVQAALRALVFTPTANQVAPGGTVTTGFTLSVSDGIAAPVTNTATSVVATSVNDAPAIGGTAAGQAVTDKTTSQPFSTVTIADPDVGASEAVTITVTAGGAASDADGLLSGVSLTKTGTGTYTLAAGSPAAVQAGLRALVFTPTANQVAPGAAVTTGFTLAVSDGIAAPVTDTGTTVVATSVNDAPSIGGTAAGQAIADTGTVQPFSAVTVADPDAGATEAATITVTANGTASDADGLLSGAGLTKTGIGTYTLAAGSPAAVQAGLRALVFTPTANQVAPGAAVTTGFTLSVADDLAASVTDSTTTVVATAGDTPPTIAGTQANQAIADIATVQPFQAVAITDPDVGASEAVTITVTAGGAASDADGLLSGAGLTKTGIGTYTLATVSPAAVQAALRALVFTPTANQVAPGAAVTTGFALSVSDGIALPVTDAATTVVATSVDDAPAIGGTVAGQAVADNATRQPFSTVTIADPDVGASEAVTITITAGGAASDADGLLSGAGLTKTGIGTYTLASGTPAAVQAVLRALVFTPTANQVAPGSTVTTGFTLSVSDGIATPTTNAGTSVVATSVNDAPSVSGLAARQTLTDASTAQPFSTATVTDPDLGASEAVFITVTAGVAASDANGTLSGAGLSKVGAGTYTLASGSPAAVQAALRGLVFTPTANQVAPGGTVTTGFALTVFDGTATATGSTMAVATSVNDTPILSGIPASVATVDKQDVTPFSAAAISDPDVGASETVTITVTADGTASDANGTLSGTGLTRTGAGTYTLAAGTPAAVAAALRTVVFTPTANQVVPGSTVATGLAVTVSDGTATASGSTAVSTSSVNDAPTIGGTQAGQVATFGVATSPFATATVADPDAGAVEAITLTVQDASGLATDANGVLSGAGLTRTGAGTYALAAAAPAAAQAALRAVQFTPTANQAPAGSTVTSRIVLSVADGIAPAVSDTTTTVVSGNPAPATITGVTASPADAVLGAGRQVTLTLAFNQAVTVAGGTPSLSLNDGGTATFRGGSGTAALVFTYVVAAGQNTVDLATTGLVLNGARIRDAAGNDALLTGAARNPAGTLAVDTVAPAVTVVLQADTGRSASDGITTTPVLTGTAEPNGTVSVSNGGAVLGNATTDATGAWSFTPVLGDGSYTLTATQLDAAGNAGSASLAFTLDRTAPALSLALANNTATAASGGTTADATLSGTGEAGDTATLTEGGTILATTAVGSDGRFSFSPALAAGPHTLAVSETDAAGNTGTAALSFRLDQPPTIAGTVAGQAATEGGTLQPFGTVTLGDPDPGATETVGITVLDVSGTATDANGTLSGAGLIRTGTGTYSLATGTAAGATAALAALVFTTATGRARAGSPATTRFLLSVTDDQGATTTDQTTSAVVAAVSGTAVFANLSVGTADPAAIVSVAAQLKPSATGSFANLGPGTLSADGLIYTVSGTAAQVNAALAGVQFTPATGQSTPNLAAATVSGTDSSTILTNAASKGVVLRASSDGLDLAAGSGADTLVAGGSGNLLRGGSGNGVFFGNATGSSTLVGGTGNSVFFTQGGPTAIIGGSGHDTVFAPVGNVTVASGTGGSLIGLGSGTGVVNGSGPDTIIAGTGAVTVGTAANSLVGLGGGPAMVSAATGTTVLGGAGADTVGVRGDGIVLFAGSGPSVFVGGSGASTVVGGAGSATVFGGAGGGLFSGGAAGNNVLVAGQGASTLFGGGNGDVLFANGSSGDVLVAGAGNETLRGTGSSGNDVFFAGPGNTLIGLGSGQDAVFAGTGSSTVVAGTGKDLFAFVNGRAGGTEVIVGFKVGTDRLSLQGYAPGEVGGALASARTDPGSATTAPSTTLTLSDNTRITFQGFTGPDARMFG